MRKAPDIAGGERRRAQVPQKSSISPPLSALPPQGWEEGAGGGGNHRGGLPLGMDALADMADDLFEVVAGTLEGVVVHGERGT